MKFALKLTVCFSLALGAIACGDEPCDNSCEFANDGICDDGSDGKSLFVFCDSGTDCRDCSGDDASEDPAPEPPQIQSLPN